MEDNIAPSIFDDHDIEQQVPFASLGQRFVNSFVDTIVFYIITWAIYFIIGLCWAFAGANEEDILELFYNPFFRTGTSLVIFVLTWSVIEGASKGRSLGKLITGTVVVRTDNSPITFKDAFIRTLSRLVPFEPVSIFFNLENGMWHDRWSNTMVIKKNKMKY